MRGFLPICLLYSSINYHCTKHKMSLTNEICLVHVPLGAVDFFLSACQSQGRQECPVASSCPTINI